MARYHGRYDQKPWTVHGRNGTVKRVLAFWALPCVVVFYVVAKGIKFFALPANLFLQACVLGFGVWLLLVLGLWLYLRDG